MYRYISYSINNPIPPQAFGQVLDLMQASFPPAERRDRAGQEKLASNPLYHLFVLEDAGTDTVCGFIASWQLDSCRFIEHFAVDASRRGKGAGGEMLLHFLSQNTGTVVLEAEPPLDDISRRRIGFYERHGFSLNPYAYLQPSLSASCEPIPLKIMTYPQPLSECEFIKIRSILYEKVYAVQESDLF